MLQDIRSKKHVEQQSGEAALQCMCLRHAIIDFTISFSSVWISERNADEALEIFNELEKEGPLNSICW